MVLLVFVGFGFLAWKKSRSIIIEEKAYQFQKGYVFQPELPSWISGILTSDSETSSNHSQDVSLTLSAPDAKSAFNEAFVRQAFRLRSEAYPENQEILDRRFLKTLTEILNAHPAVRRVERIHFFYPAQILVSLNFRVPVAVISTASNPHSDYLVDADGFVLWEGNRGALEQVLPDFCVHVTGVKTSPQPIGCLWGDPLVLETVQLIDFLQEDLSPLGIQEVHVDKDENDHYQPGGFYTLITKNGTKILWGTCSAFNTDHSVKKAQQLKLEKLKQYTRDFGSLDQAANGQTFISVEFFSWLPDDNSWNDTLINETVALTEFLYKYSSAKDFSELDILPLKSPEQNHTYLLQTQKGNQIVWGTFPWNQLKKTFVESKNPDSIKENNASFEQSQTLKIEKLNSLVQQFGSLDNIPEDQRALNSNETEP